MIGGFVYRGSQFPSAYYGSYFIADYAQHWIRRLTLDTNGTVNGVFNFEPADGSLDGPYGDPTCLKQGPDGALYYGDFSHDPNNYWAMIRRIRYVGTNQPPVVFVSALPTAGPPPLAVQFTSTGTQDPEGRALSYLWTFGDGQTSTNANPGHTYQQGGMYSARLSVSDGVNTTLSSSLAIIAGVPPIVTIFTPSTGRTFRAGNVINFSGAATDSNDVPLPPSAMNWTVVFHHATHVHPVFGPWSGTNQGSLIIPTSGHGYGYDTSYEIILIATDSTGLQSSASVTVYPELVDVSLATVPPGLTVKVDGISRVTPITDGSLIGFQLTVEAPDQVSGTSNLLFQTWSDGGVKLHTVVVPTTNLALTASYAMPPPGVPIIQSAQKQGTTFRLKFTSVAGRLYRVERSRTLLPGSWVKVADQVPGTGSLVEVADTAAGIVQQGFYRVILLPIASSGPPGFAASAEAHSVNVNTLSTSLNSPGSNRVLVVGLCWNDHSGDGVTSVTFNGVACAPVLTTNWFYGSGKIALYSLTAPATGNRTLQVTMSGVTSELSMSAIILTNANQTASIGAASANFADGPVGNIGTSVSSTTSDLVVDVLGYYAFGPTQGAGQTQRIVSDNPGNASSRMSTKPGAASSTLMSWSMSDATEISLIAVTIKGQ